MTETAEVTAEEAEIVAEMGDETGDETGDVEEGEGEGEGQGDGTEEEPEAQAGLSDKEIEKRNGALDRESVRHEKRVHEILGEDGADLIDCEACHPGVPGYHFPPENYAPGSPERALYEMLGAGEAAQMRHPDYLEVCDECNGFGNVLTGSRLDLTRTIMCPKCKSAGYIDKRMSQPPAVTQVTENWEEAPLSATTPPVEPTNDMWGRPLGHPRYGVFPIYMSEQQKAAALVEGIPDEVAALTP